MNYRLRAYRPGDFEMLWKIDQECFPPGISYSRSDLRDYLRARGGFALIAEAAPKNDIVGFIVAECHRGTGHIITIDVVPLGRRRGLGSQLLAAAEEQLQTANCHRVILEAATDNLSALAFYKRHGYDAKDTIRRYYSNGGDALVLEKKIAKV